MAYLTILLLIGCSVPMFEWMFYDYSIEHIKSIRPFRDQYTLTSKIIHFFSYAAEGTFLVGANLIYWSYTHTYSRDRATRFFNFSMMVQFYAAITQCIIKPFFHRSRPYMDDFTLSDSNFKEMSCSAEFGQPSGHTLCFT